MSIVKSNAAAERLLDLLKTLGYRFVAPTPNTHQAVLRRDGKSHACDLRDVFGWSLPFRPDLLPPPIFDALDEAGALRRDETGCKSAWRVASLGEDLFLHSAFPPTAEDAVFFGPDTYRFARLLGQAIGSRRADRIIDIGAGTGAGAVVAARASGASCLLLTDVNRTALAMAKVNLAAAGLSADFRPTSRLDGVAEEADLIIANPPFIAGDSGRTYRDGGDMRGARLSLDWALAATAQLARGGRFVLYTGSAIAGGKDALRDALFAQIDLTAFELDYDELDPDIFGDQLACEGYEDVDRIAAVGAVITRR